MVNLLGNQMNLFNLSLNYLNELKLLFELKMWNKQFDWPQDESLWLVQNAPSLFRTKDWENSFQTSFSPSDFSDLMVLRPSNRNQSQKCNINLNYILDRQRKKKERIKKNWKKKNDNEWREKRAISTTKSWSEKCFFRRLEHRAMEWWRSVNKCVHCIRVVPCVLIFLCLLLSISLEILCSLAVDAI